MEPHTVMDRYRELGSNLEASIQVRRESEEKGRLHWHRIHERCWCGYLTVPTACYEYDKEGRQVSTQAQAEKVYLASLSPQERTEIRTQPEIVQINRTTRTSARVCPVCAGSIEGRATFCSQSCQKKAYRERSK